jgi:hypothetical protein
MLRIPHAPPANELDRFARTALLPGGEDTTTLRDEVVDLISPCQTCVSIVANDWLRPGVRDRDATDRSYERHVAPRRRNTPRVTIATPDPIASSKVRMCVTDAQRVVS